MQSLKELKLYSGKFPTTRNENEYFSRDFLLKPEIHPYLIYSVLKNEFGNSNNDFFDEDKTQWSYLFEWDNYFIHIYDWKIYTTSIAIYHKLTPNEEGAKEVANQLFNLILRNSSKYKLKLKAHIKTSQHKIVENPYYSYFNAAESIFEVAKTLNSNALDEIDRKLNNLIQEDSEFIVPIFDHDKSSDLYKSAFLMYLSSFEGFLNITYELYLKEEFQVDRIIDKIAREQIDLKLILLPTYCDGFKTKVIDREDERFKNYHRLVNLRNDFVHANIVKTQQQYIFHDDKFTFVVDNEETSNIPTNINQLNEDHITTTKKIILDIIELVLESMSIKYRKSFRNLLNEEFIEISMEEQPTAKFS